MWCFVGAVGNFSLLTVFFILFDASLVMEVDSLLEPFVTDIRDLWNFFNGECLVSD